MSYQIIPQRIPQERRAELNEKILYAIAQGKDEIPKETIFNCYTGRGGLHGLNPADFKNYHDYAEAKKKYELGQFFTPHDLCRQIVELAEPTPAETILDMCCGIGNFFNWIPNLYNAYGYDIDPDVVKVARHLYPEANISQQDICCFNPDIRFDIVFGNPPYNLELDNDLSQFYFCKKAHEVLNPAGLLFLIVPKTFMQSELWDKSQILAVTRRFSFLGQTLLDENLFAESGVEDFDTKLMVFTRESEHIENRPYRDDEFVSMETLKSRILAFQKVKQSLKLQLRQETNHLLQSEEFEFNYKLNKYLYELKTHPHLREKMDRAIALVTKFRNQKPPENCSRLQYQEYEKTKLTYAKVLAVIRRYIRRQYDVPRKEVSLVKTNYTYKLKAYAPHLLDDIPAKEREKPIYELTIACGGLPKPVANMSPNADRQYAQAMRLIRRKHRRYMQQETPILQMKQDKALAAYIDKLRFNNKDMEICEFTPLQKHDMNLLYRRRYSLLNWQQGSGKTAVAYHFGHYLRLQKRIRNTVVLAPAIAIELTWRPFLTREKKRFVHVKRPDDLNLVRPGMFIVISISMLGTLERAIKRFLRRCSHKIALIFDESDEITNDETLRTRRSLNLFRRAKFKMLATGTTTRNNIGELYGQFEMLYNNSVNMICRCEEVYAEDREDYSISSESNEYCGKPFPPRGGGRLFKSCFCPGKTTVFGIEKHNQDVYNKEHLAHLIEKTILTRKFREFAGDKYEIRTHNVMPGPGEKAVYTKILKEFCEICSLYFNSTGDTKKEASLRLIRQIMLLIRACSIPNKIKGYTGSPFPCKTRYIARMVQGIPGKVAIGCTTLEAMEMYVDYMGMYFPKRPLFVIHGEVTFNRRQKIIEKFEASQDGILICTQQSLKSSANIPSCNDVILESLQWNIPKMEQFYFRFIRLDSKEKKRIHYVTYDESIEQNLIALVLTKERLNEFIKTGEVMEQSEIFNEFDISPSLIENLLQRKRDEDGNFYIAWGNQKVA